MIDVRNSLGDHPNSGFAVATLSGVSAWAAAGFANFGPYVQLLSVLIAPLLGLLGQYLKIRWDRQQNKALADELRAENLALAKRVHKLQTAMGIRDTDE